MQSVLQKIELKLAKYGEKLTPGLTSNEAFLFIKKSKKDLNWEPPSEYLSFLSKVDGFDFDGIIFTHTKNLVEENKDLKESDPEFFETYVLLGSDNDTGIAFDKVKNKFCLLDEVSHDLIDSFNSLEELFLSILKDRL